jgi:hypothetical protein
MCILRIISMNQAEAAKEREKGLCDEVEALMLRLSELSSDLEASREVSSVQARELEVARREAAEAGAPLRVE